MSFIFVHLRTNHSTVFKQTKITSMFALVIAGEAIFLLPF
ncbi:MAG: hypothetical protein ACI9SI_000359, partial [Polaribacter sp.]